MPITDGDNISLFSPPVVMVTSAKCDMKIVSGLEVLFMRGASCFTDFLSTRTSCNLWTMLLFPVQDGRPQCKAG